jgi:hypothetical protein
MGFDWQAVDEAMEYRRELAQRPANVLAGQVADLERELAQMRARAELAELDLATARERLALAQRVAWVTTPIAWHLVMPGDVVVGKAGELLHVTGAGPDGDRWRLDLTEQYWARTIHSTDPDRPVPVLRRPTADALDILARQLGATPTTGE